MNNITFNTITEALSQPKSKHFWISSQNEEYKTGDSESFFAKKLPDEYLTFDISNNKVLANIAANGSIKNLSIYRNSYYTDNIPGVWICKDFSSTGPYEYEIKVNGTTHRLDSPGWKKTTSLLDNIFPITEIETDEFNITLITYAPISSDGEHRVRGLIYGLYLENKSGETLNGEIKLPKIGTEKDAFSNVDVCLDVADGIQVHANNVSFSLVPGEHLWIPTVLYAPGEEALTEINKQGSLQWLCHTWSYFKNITGNLSMPSDPFAEEFFQRAIFQGMGAVGMDNSGEVVGSNWGTFPTTKEIWMKDMYYSYLPFYLLEPEFFKKGILWFLDRSVRPSSNKFKGGVDFSLGNSLTPIVMAGLYYTSTGDSDFFSQNKNIKSKIISILDRVLESKKDKELWLFPSFWNSDAYSLGDYHTGSNILAWYAFKTYARILREVHQDVQLADKYEDISTKIKASLDNYNVVEGPFGQQYIEGTSANKENKTFIPLDTYNQKGLDLGIQFIGDLIQGDQVNLMTHDGEESDTILIPLYGYEKYDNHVYRNFAQFSMSEHNPTYNPESRGINWGELSESTFPGYNMGLANITGKENMSGDQGYLTEIRRLTDIDGSLWWWPYENGASHGTVVRNQIGKCGWASGVYVGLFISDILGIKYDGLNKTINFRPFSPSSDFSWKKCKLGHDYFDVSFAREKNLIEIKIENHNDFTVNAEVEIPLLENSSLKLLTLNDKDITDVAVEGSFLDNNTYQINHKISPQEPILIRLLTTKD